MALRLQFIKSVAGLVPGSGESQDWFNKLPAGSMITAVFSKKQNYKFHAKLFALLKLGYDNWKEEPSPVELYPVGGKEIVLPKKDFNNFREDVTILAGFYHTVFRLDGSFKIKADSLSFDKMSPERREDFYQKVLTVLLEKVYDNTMSAQELDDLANKYLAFA